jgi:hypothetical protein
MSIHPKKQQTGNPTLSPKIGTGWGTAKKLAQLHYAYALRKRSLNPNRPIPSNANVDGSGVDV